MPRTGPGTPVEDLLRFVGCAVTCALAVYGVGSVAPRLQIDVRAAFSLAYLAVTLEILGLALTAPRLGPRHTLLGGALSIVLIVAVSGGPSSALSAALLTLGLGVGVTLLGAALGARIEQPGQLAAVALVSAIADLWSVFDQGAPSARLAAQVLAEPERLTPFALPFPILGTPLLPAVIGAGDVMFAALYVAAFRAHQLSVRKVGLALLAAFALGLVGLLGTDKPLPLLPLLGAAVIASDPAARSLSSREWRTVTVVCAALIVAIALRISR